MLRMDKATLKRIQTFLNQCLWRLLGIQWMDKVSKKDLYKRTKQLQIGIYIHKRRCGWLGHALRKPNNNVTRHALAWNPQSKRTILGDVILMRISRNGGPSRQQLERIA